MCQTCFIVRMPSRTRRISAILVGLLLTGAPAAAENRTAKHPSGAEARFLKENESAMARMMAGMASRPTGDVDADFVAMMIPHHQGAIDMAQAELRYGHNELLRRIAQEIVVEQGQEIAAMRLALGKATQTPREADQSRHSSASAQPAISTSERPKP